MTAAAVGVAKDHQKHQELFLERYNRLLKWATQLTKRDRELARDLVQEAYLRFTASANDLSSVENIDNYLYGVLRNIYLSHVRLSARQSNSQLRDLEFDSEEYVILVDDPRRQIQVRDQLRAICYHACIRKETSITGSILILRFFHGYSPSEVAKLLHSSRNIVDVQLRSARSEAIAFLVAPKAVSAPRKQLLPHPPSRSPTYHEPNFIIELRDQIFAARKGNCLDLSQLEKIYRTHKAMPRNILSHLVSCLHCLDEANRLMGMPLLHERSVIDIAGRTTETTHTNTLCKIIKLCFTLISGWPVALVLSSTLDQCT